MRSCYGISKWGLLLGQAARVTFLFGALQRNVSTPKPSGRVGGWTEHPPGSEVIGIARWPEAFQFILSLAIGRCSAGVSQQHANVPPHYGDLWQQVWRCGQLGIKPEGTCSIGGCWSPVQTWPVGERDGGSRARLPLPSPPHRQGITNPNLLVLSGVAAVELCRPLPFHTCQHPPSLLLTTSSGRPSGP